jgi:hypothetical protein
VGAAQQALQVDPQTATSHWVGSEQGVGHAQDRRQGGQRGKKRLAQALPDAHLAPKSAHRLAQFVLDLGGQAG